MIMYYVAIQLDDDGLWVETFGDHDKECVDSEVEDWLDHDVRKQLIRRMAFKRVPTQAQLEERVRELIGR